MQKERKRVLIFLAGFFGIMAPLGIIYVVDNLLIHSYAGLMPMLFSIPLAFLGLFIWLGFRKRKKPLALGFLFGGLTPFLIVFIISRGCGLFL